MKIRPVEACFPMRTDG